MLIRVLARLALLCLATTSVMRAAAQTTTLTVSDASIVGTAPSNTLQLAFRGQPTVTQVSWSTSDPTVATVNNSGLVTAVAAGSANIYATSATTPMTGAIRVTVVSTRNNTFVITASSGPVFAAIPTAGAKTVMVQGTDQYHLSIYQFSEGVEPGQQGETSCSAADLSDGTPVMISTASTTTSTIALIDGALPNPLSLTQPLVAGTTLCLVEYSTDAIPVVSYSIFQPVNDPYDFGRVRSYLTAGVQVTNQNSTGSSSTAAQYLEFGLDYAWRKASKHGPGIQTFFDAKLSPIPVASPVVTNTVTTTPAAKASTVRASSRATPADTTVASATQLNLLSSQQSARVMMEAYFPFKLTHWYKHTSYFTLAPLFRGGFATLLSPSIDNAGANGSSLANTSASTTSVGSFNSAYSFWSLGTRLAWDRYAHSRDEAPKPTSELNVTIGQYSNLPSYVCVKPPAGGAPPSTSISACTTDAADMASGLTYVSRTLVPRVVIDGFARLPNYPFILGLDANLAQYTFQHGVFRPIKNVDYLNKAGNDIRIYIGVTIDMNTLVSRLGLSLP
jgi:hypothetical protein